MHGELDRVLSAQHQRDANSDHNDEAEWEQRLVSALARQKGELQREAAAAARTVKEEARRSLVAEVRTVPTSVCVPTFSNYLHEVVLLDVGMCVCVC